MVLLASWAQAAGLLAIGYGLHSAGILSTTELQVCAITARTWPCVRLRAATGGW